MQDIHLFGHSVGENLRPVTMDDPCVLFCLLLESQATESVTDRHRLTHTAYGLRGCEWSHPKKPNQNIFYYSRWFHSAIVTEVITTSQTK
jgi:hypothetical protein